jgi:uncharacterized membrane protein YfcA
MEWWIWPLALFAVSVAFGVVAVLAGVGGGVLFVPIVGGFFPFHLDYVRAAGLLLALNGALSSSPSLLRHGLASLRLTMPLALVGSITSVAGAIAGFAISTNALQTVLGLLILGVAGLMAAAKGSEHPQAAGADVLAKALGLHGSVRDEATGLVTQWAARRTLSGIAAFGVIGFVGGMFGLGAGWANVPALNLLMGVPLKLSVGTSALAISVINSSAAWVYLNSGTVLPMLVVPSIIGVMIGAKIGVRLLRSTPAWIVKQAVLALLLLAGTRTLLKGLGIWT